MVIHAAEKAAQQGKFDVFKAYYYGVLIECADIERWKIVVFKNKELKKKRALCSLAGPFNLIAHSSEKNQHGLGFLPSLSS